MRRFWECIDDFHLGLGFCVCRVDNAERFTTRHEVQGGADIVDLRQLRFDFLPDAELLQRLLGVDAAWAGFDDADCNLAIARRTDEVEAGLDLEDDAGVPGLDEDQRIAEEIVARPGLNQLLVVEIIHPVRIRGDENVGWRALLDLLGEGRR